MTLSDATPTFSVIIPTHQSRDYVVAAIGTVLAQTDSDFEIVVIDNGSTDGTEAAVAAIGDSRITYRWQEDSGLPADSRNKGAEIARGTWLAFLDADDEWYPEKLARVRATVDADPGVDLICHDVDILNPAGDLLGQRAYRLDARPAFDQLLYRGNFLSTSAMTVRASALREAGGFDIRSEYLAVEDYDLWLRMAHAGSRLAIVPSALGTYLMRPGSASGPLVRHYDAFMRVFDAHALRTAAEGRLDVNAALTRRGRTRLAETRELIVAGSMGDALRVLLTFPPEMIAARRRLNAAARSGSTELAA